MNLSDEARELADMLGRGHYAMSDAILMIEKLADALDDTSPAPRTFVETGVMPKLTKHCRALGYHGICPEALQEIGQMIPEYEEFMRLGREFFADPVEE